MAKAGTVGWARDPGTGATLRSPPFQQSGQLLPHFNQGCDTVRFTFLTVPQKSWQLGASGLGLHPLSHLGRTSACYALDGCEAVP